MSISRSWFPARRCQRDDAAGLWNCTDLPAAAKAVAPEPGNARYPKYGDAVIERMAPSHYLSASYYERVLTAVATLCVEKGLLTRAEIEQHVGSVFPLSGPIGPGRMPASPQDFAKTWNCSTPSFTTRRLRSRRSSVVAGPRP